MEQRAIATTEAAVVPAIQWTADQINTIKNTVAKDASDSELDMFLHLAKTYDLDPFAKDIWFIKYNKSSPTVFTSRDGYLKIANRDPNFEGMDSDVVYSGDTFHKTKAGVEHSYGLKNRGTPEGAYAIVYRKDRKYPTYVYAPFKDYNRGDTWSKYPHAMILKVAEAMALKRAFSISGLVTREELDEARLEAADRPKERRPMTAEAIADVAKHLYNGYLRAYGSAEQAKEAMLRAVPGKTSSKDYTEEDLYALRRALLERDAQEQPVEAEYTETAGEIVTEMVEPDHFAGAGKMINPAPEPDPAEEMRQEIKKGVELMGLRSDEAAVFFGETVGQADLKDMNQEQLYKVLRTVRARLKKMDEEGR